MKYTRHSLHLLFHIRHDIKGTALHFLPGKKNGEKNFTGLSLSSRPKERDGRHDDNMRQRLFAFLGRTVVSDNLTSLTFVLSQRQQQHVLLMKCNFSPSYNWPAFSVSFWLEQVEILCHTTIFAEQISLSVDPIVYILCSFFFYYFLVCQLSNSYGMNFSEKSEWI